jgi:DNA polymerase-1
MRKELEAKRHDIERQAVNFEIQSGGSDVLNKASIRIDHRMTAEGWQSTINHHHHDALHMYMPPDELLPVAKMVKEEMERPVPEYDNYSFPVDIKVCNRWYDKNEEATEWLRTQLAA